MKLISLLTSCGLKVDDASLGEVFETHLAQAAQARYRSLKATLGKPRGRPSCHTMCQPELQVCTQLPMSPACSAKMP